MNTFAVLSYLNMLPFFYANKQAVFYATPLLLNDAIISNKTTLGCMSCISGIRSQLKVLKPLMGIGSKGPIQSVYLEFIHNLQRYKWEEICENLYTKHTAFKPSNIEIDLYWCQDSVQSLWLFEVLLKQGGYKVNVNNVDANLAKLSNKEIALKSNPQKPSAILAIGDLALYRKLCFKTADTDLIDLGYLWQKSYNLPCIFAMWFMSYDVDSSQTELASHLNYQIAFWNSLSEKEKINAIVSNYKNKFWSELHIDYLLNYIDNIDYYFDSSYQATFKKYHSLAKIYF